VEVDMVIVLLGEADHAGDAPNLSQRPIAGINILQWIDL
jgi:hypothetical protein